MSLIQAADYLMKCNECGFVRRKSSRVRCPKKHSAGWSYAGPLPDSDRKDGMVRVAINPRSIADYETFLRIKTLPRFAFHGGMAEFPEEYADRVGIVGSASIPAEYDPLPGLFDYQQAIAEMAIRRRKFAVFMECGLGKTLVMLEYARHAADAMAGDRCVLIVGPLMVADQTIAEAARFYGNCLPIERVPASKLGAWLESGTGRVGITNYESLKSSIGPGRLGALILDESSMLKNAYGRWGNECIRLGKGLGWKLALTGTPAPNDRVEYANHAVFLDAFPSPNAFYAKYFVNRGETADRWELKPHAVRAFYRDMTHWSIFVSDPGNYGWKDNATGTPPIRVHYHEVDLTPEQAAIGREMAGTLFPVAAGGIGDRSRSSQVAKGFYKGDEIPTNKTEYIAYLVGSWPGESTIVWCLYDREQDAVAASIPGSASISGTTPVPERLRLVDDYRAGRTRVLVSKGKILGFGLNLQVTRRMVFSGLQDSYETYWQCVKRANRFGSTEPLDVHIPFTDLEFPMIESVMRKADRVAADTAQQEAMFRNELT